MAGQLTFRAQAKKDANRLVATMCLGMIQGIRRGVTGFDEAGHQLFWPWAWHAVRQAGCSREVIQLLQRCAELGDVHRLVPEHFEAALRDMEDLACGVLQKQGASSAIQDRWMSAEAATARSKTRSKVQAMMERLLDKPVWYCFAGPGTGSYFDLLLGKKIPRTQPLSNPVVDQEAQSFDGEYALYVTCSWRIEHRGHVVSSWVESNERDGPMLRGLGLLLGERVVAVEVLEPALDLVLVFTGDKVLRLFCGGTAHSDYDATNWNLFGPGRLYVSVGPDGQIHLNRDEPVPW